MICFKYIYNITIPWYGKPAFPGCPRMEPSMPKKPMDYTREVQRLTQVLSNLPETPAKPRRTHTKRYLVEGLRETLVQLIATRGYSIQQLATLLKQHGVEIHPITLGCYLGDVSRYRQAYRQAREPAIRSTVERDPTASKSSKTQDRPHDRVASTGNGQTAAFGPTVAPQSTVAPAPPIYPVSPTPPSLYLSSRFTPKPELPYDELIRQSEARKRQRAEEAAPETAAPMAQPTAGESADP